VREGFGLPRRCLVVEFETEGSAGSLLVMEVVYLMI
jgi:hypothetical protein